MRGACHRFSAALAAACALAGGCTTVKFVQKNHYTGEVWTVYQHTMGSDTITYCPPYEGAACREAVFVDGPAPDNPPAVYPSNYTTATEAPPPTTYRSNTYYTPIR
jgi:hypothetical protein